jgi:hypothetical protein
VHGVTVDNGWKSLSHVNEWIRFADVKAGAALAATGVLGGLLVKQIPSIDDFQSHPVYTSLLALAIACDGMAALIATRILAPRLRTGEPRSLLYFDHIARRYAKRSKEFTETFVDLTSKEDRLAFQIAEQIWANSTVARRKFRRVSVSIYLLGAAMLTGGTAVLVQRIGGW